MRYFPRGDEQDKGWFAGPWNSELPVAVGYAVTGIDQLHYHAEMYELYLVAQGRCTAVVQGRELALEAGCVLIVEPGEHHTFVDSSDDYYHFVIHAPVVRGDKHLLEPPRGIAAAPSLDI